MRPGVDVKRAVLRDSRGSPPASPACGRSSAAAPAARRRARAARRRRCAGRTRRRSASNGMRCPGISTFVSCSPATTCACVTTRLAAREPAAALDPDAARGADDLHDRRLGPDDAGRCARSPGSRGVGGRGGPEDRRERIDAREQVEQVPRRHHLVQAAHDLGALHLPPQRRLPRDEQRGRAADPDEREPVASAEHEAAGGVEEPQRRQPQAARAAIEPTSEASVWSECRAGERADRARRAASSERRAAVSRCGAMRDPTYAPATSPASESALSDEPAAQPAERRQRRRPRARSSRRSPREAVSQHRRRQPRLHWRRPGGVVQLVRTPACHAGGRGFESRRSRRNSCKSQAFVAGLQIDRRVVQISLDPAPTRRN